MWSVSHLLPLWDSSSISDNAVWRAALLARELQVGVRLLYTPPAAGEARMPQPVARLSEGVAQQFHLHLAAQAVSANGLNECLTAAGAGLVVIPTAGNPLRECIMGAAAESLIRRSRVPTLVVKRTATSAYRRVLVPVDLCDGSELLLHAAAVLAPGASTVVFHSLAENGPDAAHAGGYHRDARARQASAAGQSIQAMLAGLGGEGARPAAFRSPPVPVVATGPAGNGILAAETAHRPDLIVIGKSCGTVLADFLLGAATQQVLACSESDVLVVPQATGRRAQASSSRPTGDGNRRSAGSGAVQ